MVKSNRKIAVFYINCDSILKILFDIIMAVCLCCAVPHVYLRYLLLNYCLCAFCKKRQKRKSVLPSYHNIYIYNIYIYYFIVYINILTVYYTILIIRYWCFVLAPCRKALLYIEHSFRYLPCKHAVRSNSMWYVSNA
jgi:hypothetical protein